MPISLTSVQKKALTQLWGTHRHTPLQFALVAAPEPLLMLFKKKEDAPNAQKVLASLAAGVTGFQGTSVTIGRVEWEEVALRVSVDPRRGKGPPLSEANFKKAWKAGAKLGGIDAAGPLIDKAVFGEDGEGDGPPAAAQDAARESVATDDAAAAATDARAAAEFADAMAAWTTARTSALNRMGALATAIAASRDPEAVRAIVELKAVKANITATPDTRQRIDELIAYLEGDDVLADVDAPNAFDIDVNLRAPLLDALDELSRTLPA
jgi:hypothetical protein